MVETVADAVRESVRNRLARHRVVTFVNHVAAEGQGKAFVFAAPPTTEVFAHDQSFVLIRELAFVDDQADVGFAGADGLENLIEWHDDVIQMRSAEWGVRSSAS